MVWLRNLTVEFGPVVVFFIFEHFYGFMVAVATMVVSTILGTSYNLLKGERLPLFAVLGTISLTALGTLTLVTNDTFYFIFSDTILDGLLALILLGSLYTEKPLLQKLFEHSFAITNKAWRILTVRWSFLFLLLAGTNEYIRLFYSEDVWVNYKLATIVIIVTFGCYQFTLSSRERIEGESNRLGLRTSWGDK